ncbi:MAG TPA: ferrochelatase [Gammaproteobacteria bacterium]|nr:ferrochelatase [Gammaproteobacteria bacterium]
MTRYTAKSTFTHDEPPRTGVLLTNLGTPDAPTPPALRRYLGEFLADPRVVEMPRWIWLPILHGIILRTRPTRSARAYRRIWDDDGSPLLSISRRQRAGLAERLGGDSPAAPLVELGMRYGRPAIADALRRLREGGVRRLLVFPLYPQYSASTVGSTFDAVTAELRTWRWVPELRMITHYHDHPAYIEALAASVRDYWDAHGRGDRLLFSFHGLPRQYLVQGDPYHCQCQSTARLVAARLGLDDDHWLVGFQSRFGPAQWLQPYTDETVRRLGREGINRLDVVCPGFAADCLETLEEIRLQNAEFFREAGGSELCYIECLNDRHDHLDALRQIAVRQMLGWDGAGDSGSATDRAARLRRARDMGADS